MKVIITGHSRGLGAALVETLLAEGAEVLAISRRAGAAGQRPGLTEVAMDLSDLAALEGWLASGALAGFVAGAGRAILINNAGVVDPIGKVGTLATAAIARAVTLNVAAPLMLADAFVAATGGAPDRRVVHISSGAARNPYSGWAVYCATKAALDQHAASVVEDALPGLRIESLAPGVIDTDMQATIRSTSEERFTNLSRFIALKEEGGLTTPEACAKAIAAHVQGDRFGIETLTDIRKL